MRCLSTQHYEITQRTVCLLDIDSGDTVDNFLLHCPLYGNIITRLMPFQPTMHTHAHTHARRHAYTHARTHPRTHARTHKHAHTLNLYTSSNKCSKQQHAEYIIPALNILDRTRCESFANKKGKGNCSYYCPSEQVYNHSPTNEARNGHNAVPTRGEASSSSEGTPSGRLCCWCQS